MNNNDQNKNYVTPEKVDLDKVQVNNQDNSLNRERDNIVSASIQANQAIDQKKAKKVNNQIKVKTMHPFVRGMIVIVLLTFAVFITYIGYRLVEKAINYEPDTTTTTTTTTSATDKIKQYLNKGDIVRKFQSDNNIIILSPIGYNLASANNYFLYLTISEEGLLNYISGTYNIMDGQVVLLCEDGRELIYTVSANGLVADGVTFKIFDSEMKYYKYKSKTNTKLLIINGTLKNEIALYIESNVSVTNKTVSTYQETTDGIYLSNGMSFIKNNNNLVYNGITMEIAY